MKTWRVYALPIGRPDSPHHRPRQDFGTIQADTKMRALDLVAEKIGARHLDRHHTIAVLGVGSIAVEEIPATGKEGSR